MTETLYASDVAAMRGVTSSQARRWLVAMERAHGSRYVGRAGRRLFTTREALAELLPVRAEQRSAMEDDLAELRAMVEKLAGRVVSIESRMNAHGRAISPPVGEREGKRAHAAQLVSRPGGPPSQSSAPCAP